MNKQIAEKADLFLTGLQGRYEDGKDFFLFIQIDFSSGNKVYSLKVERTGELLSYHLWETATRLILKHSGFF